MSLTTDIDYSIVVCTYNPDEHLFRRCLNAINLLHIQGFTVETILVDNNSTVPLADVQYVREFLKKTLNSKLIIVKAQGLSYARTAGVEESRGKYIVFFDDDNEPYPGYLEALHQLNGSLPHVVAWGPGNVYVDFIDGVSEVFEDHAKGAFQNRRETDIAYSNQRSWQSCYPFGTGLSVNKSLLTAYISMVKEGKFSLLDRKGNQLSSGGDMQMVLYCTSKGFAAGVAPELKLNHMVPGKRTTFEYFKRLAYGTNVCYNTCILEVFPDHKNALQKEMINEKKFVFKVLKKYLMLFFKSNPMKTIDLIRYIGGVSSIYVALNKPIPETVNWVLKKLKAI